MFQQVTNNLKIEIVRIFFHTSSLKSGVYLTLYSTFQFRLTTSKGPVDSRTRLSCRPAQLLAIPERLHPLVLLKVQMKGQGRSQLLGLATLTFLECSLPKRTGNLLQAHQWFPV